MAYWWVNLGGTYEQEVKGFMWSPQKTATGRAQSYDNMLLIKPGDIIFAHSKKLIRAIGVATAKAQHSPKPDFGRAGINWHDDGWLVEVEFTELVQPVDVRGYMDLIGPTLPAKHSPLQSNGNAVQAYLFAVPDTMATVLRSIVGIEFDVITTRPMNFAPEDEELETAVSAIEMRFDISSTEKLQLMKSRRGQGLFKANVRLVEPACRVTGVTQISMLKASHMKPWKDADDKEKVDGFNGLLLSPHVDHLFDKGFITFEDNGELVVSPTLDLDVLKRWKIPHAVNVGAFRSEQQKYLEYHQENVFKAS